MSRVEDIEWGDSPEPRIQLAAPRKCWRHAWYYYDLDGNPFPGICQRCGKLKDAAASKRGRTNRSRGNAIERWACKMLGVTRVGMFGSPEDGGRHDEPWVVQVKSGGYFTERYWLELQKLTANASQTRLLVVADTPGAGHRRRAYVVMDLDDFRALHVGTKEERT